MEREHTLKQLLRYRTPLYNEEFPVVLLWSQKAGCTSLVKWFFFQIGLLDEAINYHPWIHNYENEVYIKKNNYNKEVKKILLNSNMEVIKLVRDPYKRAVSSFLELSHEGPLKIESHFAYKEWRRIREIIYNDKNSVMGISFKQYLYYLKEVGVDVDSINGHFAQQYIEGEEQFVTKYIYLEDFDNEIRELEKKYCLKTSPLIDITNSGHHRAKKMKESEDYSNVIITEETFYKENPPTYTSFYNDETLALVEEIFKKDIEVYGYRRPFK